MGRRRVIEHCRGAQPRHAPLAAALSQQRLRLLHAALLRVVRTQRRRAELEPLVEERRATQPRKYQQADRRLECLHAEDDVPLRAWSKPCLAARAGSLVGWGGVSAWASGSRRALRTTTISHSTSTFLSVEKVRLRGAILHPHPASLQSF